MADARVLFQRGIARVQSLAQFRLHVGDEKRSASSGTPTLGDSPHHAIAQLRSWNPLVYLFATACRRYYSTRKLNALSATHSHAYPLPYRASQSSGGTSRPAIQACLSLSLPKTQSGVGRRGPPMGRGTGVSVGEAKVFRWRGLGHARSVLTSLAGIVRCGWTARHLNRNSGHARPSERYTRDVGLAPQAARRYS